METNLSGKTYVVTGATSGIGLAVAEALAGQGAMVIGVGRSVERCRNAENHLRALSPSGEALYLTADLAVQSSVRALAEEVKDVLVGRANGRPASLDGLVNNAGTFTYWLMLTPEGFETQWAVNHLAPFLLTNALLPLLRAAPAARVVTVSSDSHQGIRLNWNDIQLRRHYNGLRAYGQTKLANVLFTQELNRRLGAGSPVRAFAADPGLVRTEIGYKGTPAIVRWVWNWRRSMAISPEESARGIVYLVTEPSIQDAPQIYWRHGQPQQCSKQALDRESAARLWDLSAKMCSVNVEAI